MPGRIPVVPPNDILARLIRIAIRRQGGVPRGALVGLAREALVSYVDQQEKDLSLPPTKTEEVKEWLAKQEE